MATARHAELVSGLERLATRVTAEAGLDLVEVSLHGSSRRRVVRVDIDRAGPDGIGLQDCQRVSEALGLELDRQDLLQSGYTLEVSSPGIDRPIRTPDDVRRNRGRRVRVQVAESAAGPSEFRGVLQGMDGDRLRLVQDGGTEVTIAFDEIDEARQDVDF